MRKLFYVLGLVLILGACNSKKKSEDAASERATASTVQSIDKVMDTAEKNVGKTVKVKGLVDHTCKHSGRRCFLVNDDESLSIRVEAGGDIKSFDMELVGSVIVVKGILQQQKITVEDVDEFEAKVKAQKDTEEGGKHCHAQMKNITKMRTWMKEHNKNYYPVYFIEGQSYYEVVE